MKSRTKDTYREAILEKFEEVRQTILPEITPLYIKNRCASLINNELTDVDKNIVKSFFEGKEIDTIIEEVNSKKFDLDRFKPIQQFLSKKTTSFKYLKNYDFTAFILNFKPRPFSTYLNNGKPEESKKPQVVKEFSYKPLFYAVFFLMLLVSIWIVKDLFTSKTQKIPQKIEITNYNGNLNYYYYLNDKGKIELYDKQGIIANKPLKPVTQDVLFTYFEQNKTQDTRKWTKKVVQKTPEKPQPKPKKKSVASTKISILNNGQTDFKLGAVFKKKYNSTQQYTCKGTVNYTYRKSEVNSQLTVCDAVINYTITANKTNEELETNQLHSIGSGFSKLEAKQNAISKINFNK